MVESASGLTATGSKDWRLAMSSLKGVAPAIAAPPKTIAVRPVTPASSAGRTLSGLPIRAFAPQSLVT